MKRNLGYGLYDGLFWWLCYLYCLYFYGPRALVDPYHLSADENELGTQSDIRGRKVAPLKLFLDCHCPIQVEYLRFHVHNRKEGKLVFWIVYMNPLS